MNANRHQARMGKPGMSNAELLTVVFAIVAVVGGVFCAAVYWKRGSDRSATIMNIRNCQQAMRGEQSMSQLMPGDPFTQRDLERFMPMPTDIKALEGMIEFTPGNVVKPESSYPKAANGDHLWLQLKAPHTVGYVGRYGWDDIDEVTGW